jgi:glycosyltransferase involved in cell wall biosynthesis
MHLGIDGTCLANTRGFGRFARSLVSAMAAANPGHGMTLVLDAPSRGQFDIPAGVDVTYVEVSAGQAKAASAKGRRGLGDMLAMSRAVAAGGFDVFFFPASYTYFPVWGVGRLAVTLHDILALRRPELVFPTAAGKWAWRIKEHLAVAQADLVVTVSQSAGRDIRRWFRLPPQRVAVVTEGPAEAFADFLHKPVDRAAGDAVMARLGLAPDARFVLYVGGFGPHKNIPRLLEAFAGVAAAADLTDVRLVLVGDTGGAKDNFHSEYPRLAERAARPDLAGRVVFAGFVPDAELAHLYARCRFLAFPSLWEGFGLPAVEAMACGAPVAASTAGSLPEVVGPAGVLFPPTSVPVMRDALLGLLRDPARRDALAAAAREQSRRFGWPLAAELAWRALGGQTR